jgi:ABC-type transport system substrate-binding protein
MLGLRSLPRLVLPVFAAGIVFLTSVPHAAEPKVLRYAFPIAETGFDPAQISDLYSRTVAANIFESLLTWDYLARPAALRPLTTVALPEISPDYRTFTFRLRAGIYFADDPAFNGKPRELTAADYVYSLKRHYDPKTKSPNLFQLENAKILGLSELRRDALEAKQPMPYDTEVEGLRVLDRYTLQIRLAEPAPRFHYIFADGASFGAVAREVVDFYGDRIMEHPVGTGPFRLVAWKRSAKIVLERNPTFREQRYDARANAGDAQSRAIAARLQGQRLPLIDRVEVSIVEEAQPRWLAFLNAEHDLLDRLPFEFAPIAIPNNRLAPHLAKRRITVDRVPQVDVRISYFGMEHPLVGGYSADKVALRRAIGLAYNVDDEITLVRKGQAIPAQSIVPPMTSGYDPSLRTEMSEFNRAKAKALLDLFGYVDRDGDGWRDLPDGQPLQLEYATQPDQQSRQLAELWKKNMDAVGLRMVFRVAKWPEQLKASRAGKLMMWGVGWSATVPDGTYFLDLAYGPNKGQANHARFDLAEFNQLYKRQVVLPDGPERDAVFDRAKKLAVAYMPYKVTGHGIVTDLMHPWLVGYKRHPFLRDWWRYVDIDDSQRGPQP